MSPGDKTRDVRKPRILILSLPHGAAHQRAAEALQRALQEIRSEVVVEVEDALAHCAAWFRRYYNSYEIPLRYWPGLWRLIESIQYRSTSTGPEWLYRRGGRRLFQFLRTWDPDIVIATEVGICELASLFKRDTQARFALVGVCLTDLERAWAKPEVNLYPIAPGDLAAGLEAMGVPPAKILACGTPIDPSFAIARDRAKARRHLEVEPDSPLLLILFGGTGFGDPRRILTELDEIKQPMQVVFITGGNQRLKEEVESQCRTRARTRVLGWVDNMHEWMTAADLLVSKPGGLTLFEAIACGLPFLAFDPLPGEERRTCDWIEKWKVGYWVRRPKELAPTIERLVADRQALHVLRERALALARPRAAYDAAGAILKLLERQA